MSGHNIAEQLRQSDFAYTEGIKEPLITCGSGAPTLTTPGYLYIRTDTTSEDTRLYLCADPDEATTLSSRWKPIVIS
ncbi:MAG: hypothetical protein Unbinned2706contig1001_39 [Prokaryotic dsDNA virus sp.]|nr:MAG: hypothetical protein Unbinned2706contig1001_39 [Prokaryotic dsDNA virus sp.]|tara:strand:+ start:11480 stop:11710 length:231 start_codon:yes stop_codon:yes gene_type:complete